MLYAASPGQAGSKITFKARYQNFIGGQWVEPTQGEYFENISPVTGPGLCEIPRSSAEDIRLALDAAAAADGWGCTAVAERANQLNRIADRMEAHLEMLAVAKPGTTANRCGKPSPPTYRSPSTTSAISPAASAPRSALSEIDDDTVAYHFHEPLGVVGRSSLEFPNPDGGLELAPALAAGNCVVLKPAEQTPVSILVLMEPLIQDLLPPGVVNVVNGFGLEAWQAAGQQQAHRQNRLHLAKPPPGG